MLALFTASSIAACRHPARERGLSRLAEFRARRFPPAGMPAADRLPPVAGAEKHLLRRGRTFRI
ncbi:hypothetical protein [Desulfotomaculum copahuensis]|uniref:Uncharacterized protein n=1 Tax=Desulfotomaculum copahuensis TaxID=1838280 RepID=A0A1B7LCB3_9FIRM|nr:hypothetical protein [Desulfotomaculum copahuensis]OAT80368.1 hypothetical protein A6M21_13440 [Desulfotomaculum copahuensis]